MLSRLTKVAEEFNVAVYLTNQVQSDPGAGMTFVADPKKPVGGHIMVNCLKDFYVFHSIGSKLIQRDPASFDLGARIYHSAVPAQGQRRGANCQGVRQP